MRGFPRSDEEFLVRFGSEEACRRYLFDLRWPDGFTCPVCGGRKAWVNKRDIIICSSCHAQGSLISGTILHGTKKRLVLWFRAIWWLCTRKDGGSTRELQEFLGLGSYQTAWLWLQKLRLAMTVAQDGPCSGRVEVGQGVICEEDGKGGFSPYECAKILAALQVDGRDSGPGCFRVSLVAEVNREIIVSFLKKHVAVGSVVVSSGILDDAELRELGYRHEVADPAVPDEKGPGFPPVLAGQVGALAAWLVRTHKGAVMKKHLQQYVNEYVFRHSMNGKKGVEASFNRLLRGGIEGKATPYWKIVGRESPRIGGGQ